MVEASKEKERPIRSQPGQTLLVLSHKGDGLEGTKYDMIARVGHGPDRIVQTSLADTQPKSFAAEDLQRPGVDQVQAETAAAQAALQQLILAKTAKTQPKSFSAQRGTTQMLRYTPKNGEGERMVKVVEMPSDPLEPPKFKHKRIPRPPPSPPAPRLHSPPRKVTAEEQKAWHVPPCISSWKNPKGYTVPLDQRLAADGKLNTETSLNSRVSDLAEALFLAEKHNREEVEMRSKVERKVAEQDRRQRDEQLRLLAEKARDEARHITRELERAARKEERELQRHSPTNYSSSLGLTIRDREQIRKEYAYDLQRDLRLARLPPAQRTAVLQREADRDISEQIALGQHPAAATVSTGDSVFDERLFDRTAGIAAGYAGGEDDVYNLYDQPLFAATNALHMIYKPRAGAVDEDGADMKQTFRGRATFADPKSIDQEGPVQFEKAPVAKEDPFGVDQFLSEAKRGKRPRAD